MENDPVTVKIGSIEVIVPNIDNDFHAMCGKILALLIC